MNERRLVLVGQAAPLREEKWVKGCATPTNKTNQSHESTKERGVQLVCSLLERPSPFFEWNEKKEKKRKEKKSTNGAPRS